MSAWLCSWIAATMRGEYDGKGRLSMMAVATLYIISPIDFVPEALFLVFGLIDEISAAGITIRGIDLEYFEDWSRAIANGEPHLAISFRRWPGCHA